MFQKQMCKIKTMVINFKRQKLGRYPFNLMEAFCCFKLDHHKIVWKSIKNRIIFNLVLEGEKLSKMCASLWKPLWPSKFFFN